MAVTTDPETLHLRLLGGFRAERVDCANLACAWTRRSAKTLTKLLATCPGHALHREQIVEALWPEVDLDSALNSFGKALHAARHALEPELPPRHCSHYLRLTDGMLALETKHVVIDADRFERVAEDALRRRQTEAYEAALAVYTGELLPEDRYEDWCTERRASLAELRAQLLLGLADALEQRGAGIESAERLRQVVSEDPTREEVHRRLIRIWAELGKRDKAVRQFHACEEALRRHLDLKPQKETIELYEDVLAGRIPTRNAPVERIDAVAAPPGSHARRDRTPLVGRQRVLGQLLAMLERSGRPPMVLLTGEVGVGKTRLLEALASEAARAGTVLRGEVGAHVSHLPYGPLAVALDAFVEARSESERRALFRRHPPLARMLPSLAGPSRPTPRAADLEHHDLLLAAVRALGDVAGGRPLLFVIDDLHEADPPSLDVLRYFAHVARQRGWLLAAAAREEELQAEGGIARTLHSMLREGVCEKLELPGLSAAEAQELVRALGGENPIGDDLAREICAQAAGNPQFIEALVEDVTGRPGGRLATECRNLEPAPGCPVPPRVRFVVAAHLRGLDAAARRVLAVAAAAGTAEVPLEGLLGAAAGLESPITPAAVFEALDRALSFQILEERGRGYAFRHPLIRSVLYRELSRHRREELQAAWTRREGDRTRQLRLTASR